MGHTVEHKFHIVADIEHSVVQQVELNMAHIVAEQLVLGIRLVDNQSLDIPNL